MTLWYFRAPRVGNAMYPHVCSFNPNKVQTLLIPMVQIHRRLALISAQILTHLLQHKLNAFVKQILRPCERGICNVYASKPTRVDVIADFSLLLRLPHPIMYNQTLAAEFKKQTQLSDELALTPKRTAGIIA